MAKQTFTDADGNIVEVDDEVSLIDGHPDLKPVSPDSTTDNRFTPVRSFHQPQQKLGEDWRTTKGKEPTGYSNPVDSLEFAELWRSSNPQKGSV